MDIRSGRLCSGLRRGFGVTFCLLCCAHAAGLNQPPAAAGKVSPELLRRAATEPRLRVFVVLGEQPQREIMRRIETASQERMEVAEAGYLEAAHQLLVSEETLARRRDRVEALILENRQAAAREIDLRIHPAQELAMRRLAGLGATRLHRYLVINMVMAEIPASALPALEADPEVAAVLPVTEHAARLDVSPRAIGAPALWDRGYTGAGHSVAVLDTGINLSHPFFSGRQIISKVFLEYGADNSCFADDAASAQDRQGHGTAVASVVAAVGRGLGTLYNLKAAFKKREPPGPCDGGAASNGADVMDAFEWAVFNTPARIFNWSYGSPTDIDYPLSARLLDGLTDQYGILLVVAAGNSGPEPFTLDGSAAAYNVLGVAAFDDRNTIDRADDVIAPFSSRGPTRAGRYKPDLAAPGFKIWVPGRTANEYGDSYGTSVAAPHVAGAAALLRHSGVTAPLALKAVLINTADARKWNSEWGWGGINLNRAAAGGSHFHATLARTSREGSYRLYRGRAAGDLKATLVWNRHDALSAADSLRDLDLAAYSRANGAELARSASATQNVEQIVTSAAGEVAIKVRVSDALSSDEPFGLAISESGFASATGPMLSLQCTAPASVVSGSAFSITCEAANRGDLEAFNASAGLKLPAGFLGGASQRFGTLLAGARVSQSWGLTAPRPASRHTIPVELTSESFGEAFQATAQLSLEVVEGRPPLTVTPATVSFNYTINQAAPQAAVIRVSTPGAGVPFTATASSGWLSLSPAQGNTPAELRISVNPAGLAAGLHLGSVTITAPGAANSPQIVIVGLKVEGQRLPTVREKMMTKAVPETSACAVPTGVSSFQPTDQKAIVWFLLDGTQTGDRFTSEWYSPDGARYPSDTSGEWKPLEQSGSRCFWDYFTIAGKPAASKTGNWSVRIYANGTLMFTLSFQIKAAVTVLHKMLTKDPLRDTGCTVPAPESNFSAADSVAWVWFNLQDTRQGARVSGEWIAPDGSVHAAEAWGPLESGGQRCFWWGLEIAGQRPASLPGEWKVSIRYEDSLIFTLSFKIAAGFTLEKSLTARTVPSGSVCTEPDPVTTFARTDSRVYVWFYAARAKAGARVAVEFYSPAGELHHTVGWTPLERDGNWCYRASMIIANTAAAGLFGDWQAQIRWDDQVIASLPFRIVPIYVVDHKMAKWVPDQYCPDAPEPASAFLTTDERVWLWFYLRGTQEGDRVRAEWYRPDGELYRIGTWTLGATSGGNCFRGSTALAGTAASGHPGVWTISVFYNDEFLFPGAFTVETPPEPGEPRRVPPAARPARLPLTPTSRP